jgi:hypothetical protein
MMDQFSYSEITDSDYDMVRAWCEGHGRSFIKAEWLPATGFMILRDYEPVLAFWMYFDNSCPVTFIEWLVSRPGSTASEVRAALVYAMEAVIPQAMISHGAEVASTRSPKAIVRDMVKNGWSIHDKELCSMVYVLQEEEVLNETL